MNKPETHLLSIGEAAAALGVAVATLRRWHRQGRLLLATCHPHIKRPSSLRVGCAASRVWRSTRPREQDRTSARPPGHSSRAREPLCHRRVEDRSRARDQPNGSTTANVTKCETPATPGRHTPHSVPPTYIHSRMYVKLPRTTDHLLA